MRTSSFSAYNESKPDILLNKNKNAVRHGEKILLFLQVIGINPKEMEDIL